MSTKPKLENVNYREDPRVLEELQERVDGGEYHSLAAALRDATSQLVEADGDC